MADDMDAGRERLAAMSWPELLAAMNNGRLDSGLVGPPTSGTPWQGPESDPAATGAPEAWSLPNSIVDQSFGTAVLVAAFRDALDVLGQVAGVLNLVGNAALNVGDQAGVGLSSALTSGTGQQSSGSLGALPAAAAASSSTAGLFKNALLGYTGSGSGPTSPARTLELPGVVGGEDLASSVTTAGGALGRDIGAAIGPVLGPAGGSGPDLGEKMGVLAGSWLGGIATSFGGPGSVGPDFGSMRGAGLLGGINGGIAGLAQKAGGDIGTALGAALAPALGPAGPLAPIVGSLLGSQAAQIVMKPIEQAVDYAGQTAKEVIGSGFGLVDLANSPGGRTARGDIYNFNGMDPKSAAIAVERVRRRRVLAQQRGGGLGR
ncbi:hypothetical protein [Nocardia sp. NPDC058480]|uniref:hypothetical protein n=1 Tax=unclassified Nocardia TaxID=2637762 RepID=UPI00365BEC5C